MRLALALCLLAAPLTAQEVPSGQALSLFDVRVEPQSETVRFRFLASGLGDGLTYADVEADFAHLCATIALPALIENDATVQTIVITLTDRETEFGIANADAVQFFEAFRVVDGQCVWESF